MKALFLGRFQPFHNGHLRVVREASEEYDEVVVVIGSKQYSRTQDNPFTYKERFEMITTAIAEEGIGNVKVFGVENINDNDEYVKHLEKFVPKCEVFFSGNTLTEQLFSEKGYKVKILPRYEKVSATQIRKMIVKGEDWTKFVPKCVAKILKRIKAKEILKKVQ